MVWQLFIAHASEDKSAVAQPLAEALSRRGISVWYDKYELKLGDSLREKIDEGLAKSQYGIVILSPIFFQKFWSKSEFAALIQREVEGELHPIPVRQVRNDCRKRTHCDG